MSRFKYISADDWAAFYIDGECVDQGHSVHEDTYFKALGMTKEDWEVAESKLAYDICDTDGRFPKTWAEVEEWATHNTVAEDGEGFL